MKEKKVSEWENRVCMTNRIHGVEEHLNRIKINEERKTKKKTHNNNNNNNDFVHDIQLNLNSTQLHI